LFEDVDQDQIADLITVGDAHQLYYQKGLGLSAGALAVPQFQTQYVSISELAAQTAGLPAGSSFSFGFANALACADFDGDGSRDFAVAAGGAFGGGTHVYYQRPAGWVYQGFMTPSSSGQGSLSVVSLVVGDFNGDGLDDLAASEPGGDLATYINNGALGLMAGPASSVGMSLLRSPGVGGSASQLVSADFDGDGRADLAFFDTLRGRIAVAYNLGGSQNPGVFLPAHLADYELAGSSLRVLEAADVDGDGDIDLVGSFLLSQSCAVLSNERLANARKPRSIQRLRGADLPATLADVFVPDDSSHLQAPKAGPFSNSAADLFTFHASAAAGASVELHIRLKSRAPGVQTRLGLVDRSAGSVHWVLALAPGVDPQEFFVVVADAPRYISATQRLELCVQSSAAGGDFRLAIDQLSAEILP
jgi:hypothetical protein